MDLSGKMNRGVFRTLCAAAILIVCASVGYAVPGKPSNIAVPPLFGDNMVLQSGMSTPVWGTASPGGKVTVSVAGKSASAVAGADGKWMVHLKDLKVTDDPVTMTITSGKSTVTFSNVLIGDVWVGSGQSNMDFQMVSNLNAQEEIAAAKYPEMRLFFVPAKGMAQPRTELSSSKWVLCTPESVPGFSAVLYFFGREMHLKTGTPVGLIESALGGTPIEYWTPAAAMAGVPEWSTCYQQYTAELAKYEASIPSILGDIDRWSAGSKKAISEGTPIPVTPVWPEMRGDLAGCLFNAMINPLLTYGIRGIIWDQGAANALEPETYFVKQKTMIGSWRKLWGEGDFPFYYVQLANFMEVNPDPAGGDGWAKLREAQRKSLAIPNSGMAVTIDIGEAADPHFKDKQDEGKRLALWALHDLYGRKDLVCSGPLYKSMKIDGSAIRIDFDYVGGGLMVGFKKSIEPTQELKDGKLKCFAIAGADKKWFWADARIDGSQVVVTSPDVPSPVAVRFAFTTNPERFNFYNKEGLPASPFRTDDW